MWSKKMTKLYLLSTNRITLEKGEDGYTEEYYDCLEEYWEEPPTGSHHESSSPPGILRG